jgi:hypothetical protein
MGVQGNGRIKDSPTVLLVILTCFVWAHQCTKSQVHGLDAEEDTFDLGFARAQLEGFWCKETLGVLGIVVDDIRAQHHFAPSLVDENAVIRQPELSSRMRS